MGMVVVGSGVVVVFFVVVVFLVVVVVVVVVGHTGTNVVGYSVVVGGGEVGGSVGG